MAEAWAFEHTIDCSVSIDFAWAFWTDVKNWALDADVNSVELKGPFAAGVRGVTNSKSSGRIEWRIAEVQPGRAIFEFPAPGALGVFVWTPTDELASLNARPSLASSADLFQQHMPWLGGRNPRWQLKKRRDAMEAAASSSKRL